MIAGLGVEPVVSQGEEVPRKHMIVQGDFARDSVYFSVFDSDWPEVRERLTLLRKRS